MNYQLLSRKSKRIWIGVFLLFFLIFITYSLWFDIEQKSESAEKIKVFILAGQSNMEGRADANKLLPPDLEQLSEVQKKVQLAFNKEYFGPELFFGIELSDAWPDEKILLMSPL